MMNFKCFRTASFAALALASVSAHAEKIWGITPTNTQLISFDSTNPSGFVAGPTLTGALAGHTIRAIDFRPSTGQLYAVSNAAGDSGNLQLYTVNLATGALMTVGSTIAITSSNTRISLDFDPVHDVLRAVAGSGANVRIDPNTGALLGQDADLVWAPGEPATGTPFLTDIAYTNNFVGATDTTLFAYDFLTERVATIGTLGGAESPNTGLLHSVGPSGVEPGDAGGGFDISGKTGIAYFCTDDFPGSTFPKAELFSVNLDTGDLAQIGADDFANVLDISVEIQAVPEPATMAALGLGTLALIRRKRKN